MELCEVSELSELGAAPHGCGCLAVVCAQVRKSRPYEGRQVVAELQPASDYYIGEPEG